MGYVSMNFKLGPKHKQKLKLLMTYWELSSMTETLRRLIDDAYRVWHETAMIPEKYQREDESRI